MSKQATLRVPTTEQLEELAASKTPNQTALILSKQGYTGPTGGTLYGATVERLLKRARPGLYEQWGAGIPVPPAQVKRGQRKAAATKGKAVAKAAPAAPKAKATDAPHVLVTVIAPAAGPVTATVRTFDDAGAALDALCATPPASTRAQAVVSPSGVAAYLRGHGDVVSVHRYGAQS